jgi:RND family efflux transporter MFP subunit
MRTERRKESLVQKFDAPKSRHSWIAIVVGILVVGCAFAFGASVRVDLRKTVRAETADLAVPSVSVIRPERAALARELVLPGDAQPYTSASLFARTNGYLTAWYVDIGAHVKQGQLLAVIATPEVDQQLEQARGTLAVGVANLALTSSTAKRYSDLLASRAVSQQDVDTAVGAFNASRATVEANRASVRQLEQLQSFEQVRAPFDGTITVRNAQIGALVNSGSTATPQTELFRVVQSDKLRVYVKVPEASSKYAKPGLTADVALASLPGDHVSARLVRTASAIDPTTRTLLVELEVDNPTQTLFAGSYAEVHLAIGADVEVYTLPVETLIFRKEGLQVATVKDGRVALKPVVPGHDFGDQLEIVQGLDGTESVVLNPPDFLSAGDTVKVVASSPLSSR